MTTEYGSQEMMIRPKSRGKPDAQFNRVPQQSATLTNLIVPIRNDTNLTDRADTTDRSVLDPPLAPIFLKPNSKQKDRVKKKIDHHIAKLKRITTDKQRQSQKRSIKRISIDREGSLRRSAVPEAVDYETARTAYLIQKEKDK